jgi:hypothetical protein
MIDDTLAARGERYGRFIDNAATAQRLKTIMRATRKWDDLPPDMREALDQIACKISRLLTGDPYYADNWRDISGYATLILQELDQ